MREGGFIGGEPVKMVIHSGEFILSLAAAAAAGPALLKRFLDADEADGE